MLRIATIIALHGLAFNLGGWRASLPLTGGGAQLILWPSLQKVVVMALHHHRHHPAFPSKAMRGA